MRFLFILLYFLISLTDAKELVLYNGRVKISSNGGYYYGFLYKGNSEDETLKFKVGLKKINIYDSDFVQDENFLTVNKELDIGKNLEFGLQTIKNDLNNGYIYILNYYSKDEVDYKVGLDFSNYAEDRAYQFSLNRNSFIGDMPIYFSPSYYAVFVENDRIYNSLDLKFGYIYGKFDTSLAVMFGKTRYLVQEDEYYSCNLGKKIENWYKWEFNYQITPHYIVNGKFSLFSLEQFDIKVFNLGLKYSF